jgi:MoaA/NifB/PqqE/SkfB family radical SAM enzyme
MSTIWAIRLAARLMAGRFRNMAGPVKLIIETTRLCNSHCKTCDMWRQPPGAELHPDDLLRAVSAVGRNVSWIALTGGEVTLYPHLRYLVARLVACCPKLLLINIPLNGINPGRTASLIEQLLCENKRVLLHITLSIDGVGQDQDELRGSGQWNQTIETWRRLQALRKRFHNLRVSAQMTVSSLNISKFSAVMGRFGQESDTFIVAFGMDNRFYRVDQALGAGGGDTGRRLVTIGGEREIALQNSDTISVRDIARAYPASGLGGFLEMLFLFGMIRRLRRGSAGVACVAGRQVVFISAKGEVRPCPFFDESMGHLRDSNYDLRILLNKPEAKRVREAAGRCDKCWNNCVGLPSLIASPLKAFRLLNEYWEGRRNGSRAQ